MGKILTIQNGQRQPGDYRCRKKIFAKFSEALYPHRSILLFLKLCYIYRIVVEPETKIKEALGWALDWHCRRERIGHNTRLDARFLIDFMYVCMHWVITKIFISLIHRFGKVLWSSLTEDIIAGSVNRFGMETIAHVLFSDTPPTTIFNSE